MCMKRWNLDHGLIMTDVAVLSAESMRRCMQNFMLRDGSYRRRFLQREYGFAFDGYSHYGQLDSTHQAADDLLHSFVFSDFYPKSAYPEEFHSFLHDEWSSLVRTLQRLELAILEALPADTVTDYLTSFGHMMSANYYPPLANFDSSATGNTRLSAHPDVSLFTVFPFGMDGEFEYEDQSGQWQTVPASNNMIAFPGYLLQWLSNGAIKALNHRVRLGADKTQARYSFAVFSIPYREAPLSRQPAPPGALRETLSAAAYFKQYTALWDY